VLENFNLTAFAENLQTTFQALMEDGSVVELLMVGATDSGTTARQEQFSIVFRGPLDVFLEQRMYELKHPRMGEFALLLVPIKRDQEGFYYEASFNRIL
jgi:hypothetical protein